MLTNLPLYIYSNILSFLPIFDIHNLWQVSKYSVLTKHKLQNTIAKYNNFQTYTQLQEFYRSLQIFSLIDVLDTTYTWSEAFIIGQQCYKGTINIKVKYLGYTDNWIEWIRADGGRIAKHGSMCYNGQNEPRPDDRIIYYNRGHWLDCRFICFVNEPTAKSQIVIKYRDTIFTFNYMKEYIAPVSRRGIILR